MSTMAIGLMIFIFAFTALGVAMYYFVRGSGKNYIIAGKKLPFFLIGSMLLAQALDANATMGNATQSYLGGFWSGFQFPLGLALCLVLTGVFFAKPLNKMNLITLPDFYYRRYNTVTEVIVSVLMAFSFAILVAGNLAGAAWIVSLTFQVNYIWALLGITIFIFLYTFSGGLWACAATDVAQIYPAIIGFFGAAVWLIVTYGWDFFANSIPTGYMSLQGLTSVEHGALLNWAGILALGLGDIVALDFMERIFAAKTPKTAQAACFFGAGLTLFVGIIASFMGFMGITFFPEIADANMLLPTMAISVVPFVFGLFILGGIVAAGASTADGGILGVSSVLGRNIIQKTIMGRKWRDEINSDKQQELHDEETAESDKKLLIISRIMTIPVVAFAVYLAYVKPEPGILLVLAFDVVFAGCLVPLILGIYWKKANSYGALAAIIVGSALRLILFFTIPEHLAGLDTLIPPVVSLILMVGVSLATQKVDPPNYEVITEVPDDHKVLAGY